MHALKRPHHALRDGSETPDGRIESLHKARNVLKRLEKEKKGITVKHVEA